MAYVRSLYLRLFSYLNVLVWTLLCLLVCSPECSVDEVSIKTAADHWIVGRKCGAREVFLLLDRKQYTLQEANRYVDTSANFMLLS
eukprot:SAG31_NODE_856_length_11439_cov_3.721233_7_plen_86_part_00